MDRTRKLAAELLPIAVLLVVWLLANHFIPCNARDQCFPAPDGYHGQYWE